MVGSTIIPAAAMDSYADIEIPEPVTYYIQYNIGMNDTVHD